MRDTTAASHNISSGWEDTATSREYTAASYTTATTSVNATASQKNFTSLWEDATAAECPSFSSTSVKSKAAENNSSSVWQIALAKYHQDKQEPTTANKLSPACSAMGVATAKNNVSTVPQRQVDLLRDRGRSDRQIGLEQPSPAQPQTPIECRRRKRDDGSTDGENGGRTKVRRLQDTEERPQSLSLSSRSSTSSSTSACNSSTSSSRRCTCDNVTATTAAPCPCCPIGLLLAAEDCILSAAEVEASNSISLLARVVFATTSQDECNSNEVDSHMSKSVRVFAHSNTKMYTKSYSLAQEGFVTTASEAGLIYITLDKRPQPARLKVHTPAPESKGLCVQAGNVLARCQRVAQATSDFFDSCSELSTLPTRLDMTVEGSSCHSSSSGEQQLQLPPGRSTTLRLRLLSSWHRVSLCTGRFAAK